MTRVYNVKVYFFDISGSTSAIDGRRARNRLRPTLMLEKIPLQERWTMCIRVAGYRIENKPRNQSFAMKNRNKSTSKTKSRYKQEQGMYLHAPIVVFL